MNIPAGILQLVTFTIGNEEYAIEISKVQEINRMRAITCVPNMPSCVSGIINLRGKVIPVINTRAMFGLPEKEDDKGVRIVITDIQGVIAGVVVDSVVEVLRIPSSVVETSVNTLSKQNLNYIKGIVKMEDRLIILLNMDNLLDAQKISCKVN